MNTRLTASGFHVGRYCTVLLAVQSGAPKGVSVYRVYFPAIKLKECAGIADFEHYCTQTREMKLISILTVTLSSD
jgi:hypothetical protein